MGLTSALNTSLNGLSLNETAIDVLGNNIANAGTNGFKSSTIQFATQLVRTLGVGSQPSSQNGGTNPRQIGLGATTAAIAKDFSQGGITNSTSPSDLAIQGDGFFILDGAAGVTYSRAGNFVLDSQDKLTNSSGARVQGYIVDPDTLQLGNELEDIEIRLGKDKAVRETSSVIVNGSLKTSTAAPLGTQGSLFLGDMFTDTASGDATTDPITGATLLSSVFADGSGTAVFQDGDLISFKGLKGDRALEEQTFTVNTADADFDGIDDLLSFFEGVLGIATQTDDAAIPNDASGSGPGVTIAGDGQIQIIGNSGVSNDIDLSLGDLMLTRAGTTTELDLGLDNGSKTQSADGESAILNLPTFDSLGEQVNVKITTTLESRDGSSATYRYVMEADDDSRGDTVLGTGTFVFDGSGKVQSGQKVNVSILRDDTPADTMQFEVDFSSISGIVADSENSLLTLGSQDGAGPGTLTNFVIDESGFINGVFDNGVVRQLGQIALATFSNAQGLVEAGSSTYREGVNSGPAVTVAPGTNGSGTLRSGAIELSNTDVGRNLVDLIVASTNYRGNARVISSVQELVDELLVLGR